MTSTNKKKELVVVFAQNRFSQLHWLLLIAAFSLVGTVPTFKQIASVTSHSVGYDVEVFTHPAIAN